MCGCTLNGIFAASPSIVIILRKPGIGSRHGRNNKQNPAALGDEWLDGYRVTVLHAPSKTLQQKTCGGARRAGPRPFVLRDPYPIMDRPHHFPRKRIFRMIGGAPRPRNKMVKALINTEFSLDCRPHP